MNRKYLVVARRAEHRCEYCRAPEAAFNFQFEIEHIQPSSDGGSSEDSNLALGCRSCNQFKSDSTTGEDPETGEIARLYHPRTDRWEEHFSVDSEYRIVGRTAVGRATIETLRMNSARQVGARRLWASLKIFP